VKKNHLILIEKSWSSIIPSPYFGKYTGETSARSIERYPKNVG
jgi:hypothetical protein